MATSFWTTEADTIVLKMSKTSGVAFARLGAGEALFALSLSVDVLL